MPFGFLDRIELRRPFFEIDPVTFLNAKVPYVYFHLAHLAITGVVRGDALGFASAVGLASVFS